MFGKKKLAAAAVTTNPAPAEGTDWIPEGGLTPVHVEESAEAEIAPYQNTWEKFWSIFKHNKVALVSLIVIILYIVICVGAPFFAPYDPVETNLANGLALPSAEHPLGCDKLGRDVLSRMIYGGRISLMIGLFPTLVSMTLGAILGITAGFIGGKVDMIIMRIADICMAFPSLLLAMVVSYTIGPGFLTSIGVKRGIIMLRHILPNCLPTLIVMLTNHIPGNILTESSLSFLGIGAQPPMTSWGLMVYQTKSYLDRNPTITLAPGIAILVLVVAFNFLGDAVRDKLDPRLQEQ